MLDLARTVVSILLGWLAVIIFQVFVDALRAGPQAIRKARMEKAARKVRRR
jgi:hypothetical protein